MYPTAYGHMNLWRGSLCPYHGRRRSWRSLSGSAVDPAGAISKSHKQAIWVASALHPTTDICPMTGYLCSISGSTIATTARIVLLPQEVRCDRAATTSRGWIGREAPAGAPLAPTATPPQLTGGRQRRWVTHSTGPEAPGSAGRPPAAGTGTATAAAPTAPGPIPDRWPLHSPAAAALASHLQDALLPVQVARPDLGHLGGALPGVDQEIDHRASASEGWPTPSPSADRTACSAGTAVGTLW